jgi:hypothetical protein
MSLGLVINYKDREIQYNDETVLQDNLINTLDVSNFYNVKFVDIENNTNEIYELQSIFIGNTASNPKQWSLYFEHKLKGSDTQLLYIEMPFSKQPGSATYKNIPSIPLFNNKRNTSFILPRTVFTERDNTNNPPTQGFAKRFSNMNAGVSGYLFVLSPTLNYPDFWQPNGESISDKLSPYVNSAHYLYAAQVEPLQENVPITASPPQNPMSCKRKANTGIFNNTIIGEELATKLNDANKDIIIVTVVFFFVSLIVIVMTHLSTKDKNTNIFGYPNNIPGTGTATVTGGAATGGYCNMESADLSSGYIFAILFGLTVLHFYGAIYLKETFMIISGVSLLIATVVWYVRIYTKQNYSLFDLELEHFLLYSKVKPVAKWFAISAHYVWSSLFFATSANYINTASFLAVNVLYVLLAFMGWRTYTQSPGTSESAQESSITISQLLSSLAKFPIFILVGSYVVMQIIIATSSSFTKNAKPVPVPNANSPSATNPTDTNRTPRILRQSTPPNNIFA